MLRATALLLLFASSALSLQDPTPAPQSSRESLSLDKDGWYPVRSGINLENTESGALHVAYERMRMKPAGTVTRFASETLTGLSSLQVQIEGGEGALVTPSLRLASGVVYSWPGSRLSAKTTTLKLDPAKLSLDRMQSNGATDAFVAAQVIELRLVDISAYMGGSPGPLSWTVTSLDFERSANEPQTVVEDTDGRVAGGDAEAQFFAALVDGRGAARDVIAPLVVSALQAPKDARPRLLLGLAHLWIAAEATQQDPLLLEHLLLADRYFDDCAALDANETRLASWQVPVQLAIEKHLGSSSTPEELLAPLERAFEADPGFHGFSMGLVGFEAEPGSPIFERGLKSVRAALASDPNSPSVQNRPHWPHNVEGFLMFAADYEWRAGQAEAARALLAQVEAVPDFAKWPYRDEVESRRAQWMKSPERSPQAGGPWMPGRSCVVCHRAK